jgi:BMFP domain-containing protein YqiC
VLDFSASLKAIPEELTVVTSPQQLLADAQVRLAELLRASPAADLERNLKALLAQTFQKLELVTREEFEVERERLARLQIRLEALEREWRTPSGARTAGPQGLSPVAAQHPDTAGSQPAVSPPPANPYQMPPETPPAGAR